jgi:hypothetical protein
MDLNLSESELAATLSAINDSIRQVQNDPLYVGDLRAAYRKLNAVIVNKKPVINGGSSQEVLF